MTRPPRSPAPYAGPLEAHLGFWLRFVSNHVSGAFRQKLATHGVSVAEWALLRELEERGAIPPSRLAAHLGMTRGGITKVADKLVARSLVTRTPDADDLRGQLLGLSGGGRRLIPVLAALADANEREFFGHLPARQLAEMTSLLRGLVAHHGLHGVPLE